MDDRTLRDRFVERRSLGVPPFEAMLDATPRPRRIRPLGVAALTLVLVLAAVVTVRRERVHPVPSAAELMAWTATTDALLPPGTDPMAFGPIHQGIGR